LPLLPLLPLLTLLPLSCLSLSLLPLLLRHLHTGLVTPLQRPCNSLVIPL
jgi:hypothetical protein